MSNPTPEQLIVADQPQDYRALWQQAMTALLEERGKVANLEKRLESYDVCWHCNTLLVGRPLPRCFDCPEDCDDPQCNAAGCEQRLADEAADVD